MAIVVMPEGAAGGVVAGGVVVVTGAAVVIAGGRVGAGVGFDVLPGVVIGTSVVGIFLSGSTTVTLQFLQVTKNKLLDHS